MKHAEHNKNPKRPVYPGFDITNEAAHLVESESISNSDIAIIITDHNGKIISTSEPVTKDMQNNLLVKQKLSQTADWSLKGTGKIKVHHNSKPT